MCGGGNLYTLYTLLSSDSNEILLNSYFMLSLKVAFSECDFLFLKRLLTSQKSWCHRQINMEVWREFFVIHNTYSGVWSPWLKSLQYYNHFQSTIANQRGKPLGRCWSKVGVFPLPLSTAIIPIFSPFSTSFHCTPERSEIPGNINTYYIIAAKKYSL